MIGLTPSQKGAAAEAAITSAVIQLGLTVLRPLCEGRRYDLIVDLEPTLLRVQCKLARRRGGVLVVGLQTSRHTPGGYVFTSYPATEIDAVVAFPGVESKLPAADCRGGGKAGCPSPARARQESPGKGRQMGAGLLARADDRAASHSPTGLLFGDGQLNSADQISGL
jgi:PD-(D/E)XK endonuclease